jgi:hypothetical protein
LWIIRVCIRRRGPQRAVGQKVTLIPFWANIFLQQRKEVRINIPKPYVSGVMRNHHHHPYRSLREWHAGQREQRKRTRWIPYSLRWEGGGLWRIFPQVCTVFFLDDALPVREAFINLID